MDVTVSKWGNSSGIRIPNTVMKDLNILDGDTLFVNVQGDAMIIRKKKTTRQMFEEFYGKPYEQITDSDIGSGEEMDWGSDIGDEVITKRHGRFVEKAPADIVNLCADYVSHLVSD